MNAHSILTLTDHPADESTPVERLKVRIEGEIEPAKIIEIYRLLNAPSRRRRSDAGKARKPTEQ